MSSFTGKYKPPDVSAASISLHLKMGDGGVYEYQFPVDLSSESLKPFIINIQSLGRDIEITPEQELFHAISPISFRFSLSGYAKNITLIDHVAQRKATKG